MDRTNKRKDPPRGNTATDDTGDPSLGQQKKRRWTTAPDDEDEIQTRDDRGSAKLQRCDAKMDRTNKRKDPPRGNTETDDTADRSLEQQKKPRQTADEEDEDEDEDGTFLFLLLLLFHKIKPRVASRA